MYGTNDTPARENSAGSVCLYHVLYAMRLFNLQIISTDGNTDNTTYYTTVTTVRAAGGNIFLPMEGHSAIAAPTTANRNSNLIYKHRIPPVLVEG